MLEKTLENPVGSKKIKPVNPKGNQSWIFIGRTNAEAEALILWPPDEKNWFTGKDPDAGKDWRQEEKGTTEDEMIGWHHRLDGHDFEQAPGVGDGQGSLVCCSPWLKRAGHDWVTELNRPTPEFLPGEFHGQRSLEGYSPWGHKEWDTTEWLSTYTQKYHAHAW